MRSFFFNFKMILMSKLFGISDEVLLSIDFLLNVGTNNERSSFFRSSSSDSATSIQYVLMHHICHYDAFQIKYMIQIPYLFLVFHTMATLLLEAFRTDIMSTISCKYLFCNQSSLNAGHLKVPIQGIWTLNSLMDHGCSLQPFP